MAKGSIHRGFTIAGGIVLGLVLLVIVLLVVLVLMGIPRNAAGMAAKGICSAAFVAGRSPLKLMADEVLPASPVLNAIGISIDQAGHSVTAHFAGLFERRATLLPDRGCVLDVNAGGQRAPESGTPLLTNPGLPWPLGQAPLPVSEWGAGVDAKALHQLVQQAFVGAGRPDAANARGVAIVHKGRMLVLYTAPGFDRFTPLHGWSMAKTVLGMLSYKLALENGLSFDTPVVDAFPKSREPAWVAAWRGDARTTIKLSDLMYMRDGLASTEDYDPWGSVPRMLWGQADAAAFAASAKPEALPGERWRYLSASANLMAAVDRARFARDSDYWAYPARALFEPIGAHTAVMETDSAGNWVGSSYLWASVGDWARFGQLMLSDGRWNGKRILPPGWLTMAIARSTARGEGRGYGAMVWRIGDPDEGQCKAYGLPADTIAMSGHWGQIVAMVPSRDAVIVRLGWTFRRKQFDACAFVAAALKALPH